MKELVLKELVSRGVVERLKIHWFPIWQGYGIFAYMKDGTVELLEPQRKPVGRDNVRIFKTLDAAASCVRGLGAVEFDVKLAP